MSMIKASSAAFFIRNRKHFHEAMEKSGFCLPSMHSAMCTLEWMYGVRFGTYYCPQIKDRNFSKTCHHPPPKNILIEKLEAKFRP